MTETTTEEPCPECRGLGFFWLPPRKCFLCRGDGALPVFDMAAFEAAQKGQTP